MSEPASTAAASSPTIGGVDAGGLRGFNQRKTVLLFRKDSKVPSDRTALRIAEQKSALADSASGRPEIRRSSSSSTRRYTGLSAKAGPKKFSERAAFHS